MTSWPKVPEGFRFHHMGYATSSIEKERPFFESLGYDQEGDEFLDPIQGIAGCFMIGPGPRIELLENTKGSSTLTPWLNAGVKMYHFSYRVESIESAIKWSHSNRAKVTVQPVPAVAFGGNRVSFVMFRNRFLIEFIESTLPN